MNGGVVLFMVLGVVLAVFARPFTAWSLRWVFSQQQLAERNEQGSTRLLTGSTGKTEGSDSHSTPTCEGTATTPLGFDGQYTSPDTGLVYLRNRVYDPATVQFLTVGTSSGRAVRCATWQTARSTTC
jgi:RHS repeat-associated protein